MSDQIYQGKDYNVILFLLYEECFLKERCHGIALELQPHESRVGLFNLLLMRRGLHVLLAAYDLVG